MPNKPRVSTDEHKRLDVKPAPRQAVAAERHAAPGTALQSDPLSALLPAWLRPTTLDRPQRSPTWWEMMREMAQVTGNRGAQGLLAGPGPAAAPAPGTEVAGRAPGAADPENSFHRIANDITGLFEGGKTKTLNLYDKGIISYGKHQATLASGSLYQVLQRYTKRSKSASAAAMTGYLDRVARKDKSLRTDAAFIELLKDASGDPEMAGAQDDVFTTVYWDPAKKVAASAGIQSALGHALLYDTHIHGGLKDVMKATRKALGGDVGDVVKGAAISEQTFLRTFVDERRKRQERVIARDRGESEAYSKAADALEEQAKTADAPTAKKLRGQAAGKRADAKRTKANADALDTSNRKTRIPSFKALVDAGDLDLHGDAQGKVEIVGKKTKITGLKAGATIDGAASGPAQTPAVAPAESAAGLVKMLAAAGATTAAAGATTAAAGRAAEPPAPILAASSKATTATTATPAPSPATTPVAVTFGSDADASTVTTYSLDVLRDIARAAGLTSVVISSTARTAKDQARAMYANLVGSGKGQGVTAQRKLYGAGGDQVIDVFVASQAAGRKPDEIKADMEAKIIAIGPTKVSRHCGDPKSLNVFDVAPSSIGTGHSDDKAQAKFKAAAQAEVGKRVSKFIPYPDDPGHHFEIVPQ